MHGFIASTDLVGFIDIGCYFVEDHVRLLPCVVIYDVQQTIRDWGVDLWYQQHLLRNQEHLSLQTTKMKQTTRYQIPRFDQIVR